MIDPMVVVALVVLSGMYLHARWTAAGLRDVCASRLKDVNRLTRDNETLTTSLAQVRDNLIQTRLDLDTTKGAAEELLHENQNWRAEEKARLMAASN